MVNDENCQSCHWYQEAPSEKHGYCHRYPPVFTHNDEKGRPRFFCPVVNGRGYCGEWEERD